MTLDDVLRPGLLLVICGTAAGKESAARKMYYAGRGNRLWETLAVVGLTDVVKGQAGMDDDITFRDTGADRVRSSILSCGPKIVCFNGKRVAREFLRRKAIGFGLQPEVVGDTRLFVAPSTSGAANRYWSIEPWRELVELVRRERERGRGCSP